MHKHLGALGAIISLSLAVIGAEPLSSIPNPRTRDGTWVVDVPGILRAETVARLNASINDLERATGAEMAVVVIGSLDGLSIDEAAAKLFDLWDIGKAGKDNGLLLLWSSGDRRVRVEVGYGLEGILPDGKVGAILDTFVIPRFQAGEFDAGLLAGVDALASTVNNRPVALLSPSSESYENGSSWIRTTLIGLLGAIPAGLGSIVGVRKWRRHRRRRCPQCSTVMVRLSEAEDDALLEKEQQVEERIGSVDYDVWNCSECSHHFTLRYPKWVTAYAKCPQCGNRTKSSTQNVIERATTTKAGTARVEERCEFCRFRREYTKVIPRVQSSSSGGSSRSGSSSSFGGGRSGGGGASRGY